MRIGTIISLFLFIGLSVLSQDSLQIYLHRAQEGEKGDMQSAVNAGLRCIEISDPQADFDVHFHCRMAVAGNYYDLGQPWEAERIILPAIDLARKEKTPRLLLNSLLFYQDILSAIDRPDESWPILQECLQIAESLQDSALLGKAYYSMGYFILYFNKLDHETGMEYLNQAFDIFQQQNDLRMLPATMRRIANYTKDEVKAEAYLKQVIRMNEQAGNEIDLGWSYFGLAVFYNRQGKWEEAIENLEQSLALHEKNEVIGGVADVLLEIGLILIDQEAYDQAIPKLEESLKIAQEIPLYPNIRDATSALARAYAAIGVHSKAYQYIELSSAYKDSTFFETLNQQIAESNARYEHEKLEKSIATSELEIIKQKNLRNRVLGIMGLTLFLAMIAFQLIYYRQKRKKDEAELALVYQSKEAERLREINKLKTNFFTNISHELRTPLTLILSPLADVIENITSKPIRAKLGLVQRNGQQLLDLVNEIMDLSKAEAGKLNTHLSPVDLDHTVKRIFSAYESLASIRRIRYHLSVDLTDKYVLIDIDKLEKILNNLLTNAIKYTASDGEVSLDISQQSGSYVFVVKDTGQGIHPQDQPHIFDRFYQAENRVGSLKGGTGIGLSLVKELTKTIGGTIDFSSEWKKGSEFRLRLPLQLAKLSPHPKADKPAAEDVVSAFVPNYAPILIQGDKPRLLIVEDHPEMGKYLLEVLSDHYHCVLASDGEQALKQLKLASFDGITSDVMMPNMDGFQLREEINKSDIWRRIPFLLLTARHLEADKLHGFQLGIDDYITKPFSTRELHARLHRLILHKIEREQFAASEKQEELLSVDQTLLKKMETTLLANLDEEQFKVEDLAKAVNYSPKQMGRLIKKHTGMSSVQFMLEVRLQKARELLEKRHCATVFEAQYAVGIQSTSYFTRKFTERFGKNPKRFLHA